MKRSSTPLSGLSAARLDTVVRACSRAVPSPVTAVERARGTVFTPAPLAELLAELCGVRGHAVFDPACGDGALLAAARAAGAASTTGGDQNPQWLRHAQARLPDATLVPGDALWQRWPDGFARIVSNPPYVRAGQLRQQAPAQWQRIRDAALATTAHGEWDLSSVFVERSLTWLTGDGCAAFILPARLLVARSTAALRALLAPRVHALIDFGAQQLFPDAATYTSIVVVGPARAQAECWQHREAFWQRARVALPVNEPWRLPPHPRAAVAVTPSGTGRAGRSSARRLGDVIEIAKGTGTSADAVFVVGTTADVEAPMLRACLRGRDVGRGTSSRCVFPYRGSQVLTAVELAHAPKAARYLAQHRDRLLARSLAARAPYWAFGRPQNHEFLLAPEPKLVVPDIVREPRAMIDDAAALVLDSAYAIRSRDPAWPLARLYALFTSAEFMQWLARASMPLRGGYYRIKPSLIRDMPVG